jgi:hypothetical protein
MYARSPSEASDTAPRRHMRHAAPADYRRLYPGTAYVDIRRWRMVRQPDHRRATGSGRGLPHVDARPGTTCHCDAQHRGTWTCRAEEARVQRYSLHTQHPAPCMLAFCPVWTDCHCAETLCHGGMAHALCPDQMQSEPPQPPRGQRFSPDVAKHCGILSWYAFCCMQTPLMQ